MEPSSALSKQLHRLREAHAKAQTAQKEALDANQDKRESEAMIAEQCRRARGLSEKHAQYAGSQVYLGRDALQRDYHSNWATFNLDGETATQVQLERTYKVQREFSGLETGQSYEGTVVRLRLKDLASGLATRSEDALKFGPSLKFHPYVLIPEQAGNKYPRVIKPQNPEWHQVEELLDQLENLKVEDFKDPAAF